MFLWKENFPIACLPLQKKMMDAENLLPGKRTNMSPEKSMVGSNVYMDVSQNRGGKPPKMDGL